MSILGFRIFGNIFVFVKTAQKNNLIFGEVAQGDGMEKLDAVILKYIRRKRLVEYNKLLHKFGKLRCEAISNYIYSEFSADDMPTGKCGLKDEWIVPLENFLAERREMWFKYWFTMFIPLFALLVSIASLIIAVLASPG